VEGDDGPFAGDFVRDVTTAGPDEPASAVRDRLAQEESDRAVVTVADGIVLGLVERRALEDAGDAPVAQVMTLSPTTVRPSVEYDTLVEQGDEHVLVTTSDGRLVGMVEPEGRDDEGGEGGDLERSLLETVEAVDEHFGGRDVSEEEIRGFLRERLVAEGKTPEEADRFVGSVADQRDD